MSEFDTAAPGADLLGLPPTPLTLRLSSAKRSGQLITIDARRCWIGSGPGCTVRLKGANVDPVHCLILRGEREMLVRRLAPDTRLNGHSFSDARLTPGDRLSVGPVDLEILPGASLAEPALKCAANVASDEPELSNLPVAGGEASDADSSALLAEESPPQVSGPLNRRRARTLVRHAKNLRRQLIERTADDQRMQEEITHLRRAGEEAESSRENVERLEAELEAQRSELERVNEELTRSSAAQEQEDQRRHETRHDERETLEQQKRRWEEGQREKIAEIDKRDRQVELARARLEAERDALKSYHDQWQAEREEAKIQMKTKAEQSQQLEQQLTELRESLDQDRQHRETGRREQASEVEQRLARLELACSSLERERKVLGKTLREEQSELKARVRQLDGALSDSPPSPEISSFDHRNKRAAGDPVDEPEAQHAAPPESRSAANPSIDEQEAGYAALHEQQSAAEPETDVSEEPKFATPSDRPPVSASDILERLVAAPAESDDVNCEAPPAARAQEPPARTAAVLSPSSDEPAGASERTSHEDEPAGAPEGTSHEEEVDKTEVTGEEDSIEDYMNRLLARTRGDAPPASAASKKGTPAAAPSQSAQAIATSQTERKVAGEASPSGATTESTDSDATPKKKPKRRVPPMEMTSDLPAMRELAKMAAQNALDQHARGKQRRSRQIQTMTFVAMFVAGIFLVVRTEVYSWPFVAGLIGLAGATLWGLYRGTLLLMQRRVATGPQGLMIDAKKPPNGESIAENLESPMAFAAGEPIEADPAEPVAAIEAADVSEADLPESDRTTKSAGDESLESV